MQQLRFVNVVESCNHLGAKIVNPISHFSLPEEPPIVHPRCQLAALIHLQFAQIFEAAQPQDLVDTAIGLLFF